VLMSVGRSGVTLCLFFSGAMLKGACNWSRIAIPRCRALGIHPTPHMLTCRGAVCVFSQAFIPPDFKLSSSTRDSFRGGGSSSSSISNSSSISSNSGSGSHSCSRSISSGRNVCRCAIRGFATK
jgi:hypothetical protein